MGIKTDTVSEAVKAAPPVTVSGMMLFDIPLDAWVQIATLVYIVLQIGFLLYGKFKKNESDKG